MKNVILPAPGEYLTLSSSLSLLCLLQVFSLIHIFILLYHLSFHLFLSYKEECNTILNIYLIINAVIITTIKIRRITPTVTPPIRPALDLPPAECGSVLPPPSTSSIIGVVVFSAGLLDDGWEVLVVVVVVVGLTVLRDTVR